MSLKQLEKDLESQLEEALKEENNDAELERSSGEVDTKASDNVPDAKPEKTDETPKEEKDNEEKNAPETEEIKEPKEEKGAARLRREKAAAEKRARELEEENTRLKSEREAPQEEVSVPEPVSQEIREFMQERIQSKAEREFTTLENQVKGQYPDYEQVSKAYQSEIYKGVYAQNPRKTPEEVWELTKTAILNKAAEYHRAGFNAAEELYHDGKEMSDRFGLLQKPEPKEEVKTEPKPDMAKVASNRARSAGLAGAAGESKSNPTPQHVATSYTAADIAKMSDEQFKAVISQIR